MEKEKRGPGKNERGEGNVKKGEARKAMKKAAKELEESKQAGKAGTGMEPPPPKPKEGMSPTSKKRTKGKGEFLRKESGTHDGGKMRRTMTCANRNDYMPANTGDSYGNILLESWKGRRHVGWVTNWEEAAKYLLNDFFMWDENGKLEQTHGREVCLAQNQRGESR